MLPLSSHIPELAVAAALAWASGLRLYLVLFVVGFLGRFGAFDLPGHLQLLSHPIVLAASGFMVLVEFFADKTPFFDSLWDAVHTFIRIPGGALLAAEMMGDTGDAAFWAAAILGGSVAAVVHGAKASSRAFINASPEPFSNWAASLSEDTLVLGGLWAAFQHPVPFLIGLCVFLAAAVWLIWRLAGFLRAVPSRLFARARNGVPQSGSKKNAR